MSGSGLSSTSPLAILAAAADLPESADIITLAQQLLGESDLATGGSILLRLAQIIELKASALLSSQPADNLGAVDDLCSAFDDFGLPVVGRVDIDLDDLLLPASHHYPDSRQSFLDDAESTLSHDQIYKQLLELSHAEDIPGWSKNIRDALATQHHLSIGLPQLLDLSGLSLIELWLGLLLGGLDISIAQRSNDFYSCDGIEVSCILPH